jgi:hypothetical protein
MTPRFDACGGLAPDQGKQPEQSEKDADLRALGQHVMTASMPHRHGLRTGLVIAFGLLAACGEDKLKGPEAEVRKSDVKLNIPAVPAFDLANKPVKELRVKGRKKLKTEITVKGFVTWVYDCPTAIREPGEDDKAVQERIDADPTLCERAKFYVGDDKDTPAEKSLWVVDVPRPYTKLDMKRLKKKDRTDPLKCEPDEKDKSKSICPPYAVGDEVEVTGTFDLASPHSERNSDGLLVYKKMINKTQPYESPPPDPAAEAAGTAPGAKPSPEDLVKKKG